MTFQKPTKTFIDRFSRAFEFALGAPPTPHLGLEEYIRDEHDWDALVGALQGEFEIEIPETHKEWWATVHHVYITAWFLTNNQHETSTA